MVEVEDDGISEEKAAAVGSPQSGSQSGQAERAWAQAPRRRLAHPLIGLNLALVHFQRAGEWSPEWLVLGARSSTWRLNQCNQRA